MNSFAIRFTAAAALVTMGCLLLLSGFSGIGPCFGLATLCYMPRSELTEPVRCREAWLLTAALLAFAGVIVACEIFVPSSVGIDVKRIIRHPAVVLSLWVLMLLGLYRQWQLQKKLPLP